MIGMCEVAMNVNGLAPQRHAGLVALSPLPLEEEVRRAVEVDLPFGLLGGQQPFRRKHVGCLGVAEPNGAVRDAGGDEAEVVHQPVRVCNAGNGLDLHGDDDGVPVSHVVVLDVGAQRRGSVSQAVEEEGRANYYPGMIRVRSEFVDEASQ